MRKGSSQLIKPRGPFGGAPGIGKKMEIPLVKTAGSSVEASTPASSSSAMDGRPRMKWLRQQQPNHAGSRNGNGSPSSSTPMASWMQALSHYQVAVACGAPLSADHAFRVSQVFARGDGNAEQLLRWWLLFRCEDLPPTTTELVALHRHNCWQEALYTIATVLDPWDPQLAKEAMALYLQSGRSASLPGASVSISLPPHHPSSSGGAPTAHDRDASNRPDNVVDGSSPWTVALAMLMSAPRTHTDVPNDHPDDVVPPPPHPLVEVPTGDGGTGYGNSTAASSLRRSFHAVPAYTPTSPSSSSSSLAPQQGRDVGYPYEIHREELRIPAVAQARRNSAWATATTLFEFYRHNCNCMALGGDRSAAGTGTGGRDGDSSGARLAISIAVQLYNSVLPAADRKEAIRIAVATTMQHQMTEGGGTHPALQYFEAEVAAGRSPVVSPSVGNVIARLYLQRGDRVSCAKVVRTVERRFGALTVSALLLRDLCRTSFLHTSEDHSQRRTAAPSIKAEEDAAVLGALAACSSRLGAIDRQRLAERCLTEGTWKLALTFGGVQFVLGDMRSKGNAEGGDEKSPQQSNAGPHGELSTELLGGALVKALGSGNRKDTARLTLAAAAHLHSLALPALDALATSQVQSGHWLQALSTINRLVFLAEKHNTEEEVQQQQNQLQQAESTQSPPKPSLSLLEVALLDSVKSVETWRDALDLFQ